MEFILGIQPMCQFDRAATPMTAAFSATPNLRPYDALMPSASQTARNGLHAWMAGASLSIDVSEPDRIPMGLMNENLWRSVRGQRPPVRRAPARPPAGPAG